MSMGYGQHQAMVAVAFALVAVAVTVCVPVAVAVLLHGRRARRTLRIVGYAACPRRRAVALDDTQTMFLDPTKLIRPLPDHEIHVRGRS